MKNPLLVFNSNGIYCPKGDFYIDPWKPVDKAIITHAHSDHAKAGHRHYLSHHDSKSILKQRLGWEIKLETKDYGEIIKINEVKVSLHPAGHILGSAQIRVEAGGEVWCVSGDYKTQPDPIAVNFEPVPCHTFITECTFGLPVYQWPDEAETITQIENWWKENQQKGKISLISAYSLGKAQRILALIDQSIGKIYCHGAVHTVNELYKRAKKLQGHFPYLSSEIKKEALIGTLIIAPPSAVGSSWAGKLKPLSVGAVSGWMMLRGSKRRQNVDRGFILSDHADWQGLNKAIRQTQSENVICTHGYAEVFAEWLNQNGYNGMSEKTFFESENSEVDIEN
ncbi:MAG: ligase-associated DNA damage response exonuclease [Ekhidna sp.]|nr:ligase-associated DNA damage response exonuclease [Ekhidna sp.]